MPTIQKTRTGSAGQRIVDVVRDTVAPGVNDDSNDDYIIGTIWEVVDANDNVVSLYQATSVASGAATWAKVSEDAAGLGRKLRYIEEALEFTADATADLTEQLPAGAVPIAAVLNLDTAVVLDTAVKIGFGTAGDPDGYALSGTTMTKNQKAAGKGALCGAMVAAATTMRLTACDTNGAAAGTVTSGTVRARVYYEIYDPIADAA